MNIEVVRNEGSGMAPIPSPSDVKTNAAKAQQTADANTPTAEGLPIRSKKTLLSRKTMRIGLGLVCLSPILFMLYHKGVPRAPMKSEEGTWQSVTWQNDIPATFRTRLRANELIFFRVNASTDACETEIGRAPRLTDAAANEKQGWITDAGFPDGLGFKITAWRSGGQLAISYDKNDPWVFFTRGLPPKRLATVRYQQIDTKTCEG